MTRARRSRLRGKSRGRCRSPLSTTPSQRGRSGPSLVRRRATNPAQIARRRRLERTLCSRSLRVTSKESRMKLPSRTRTSPRSLWEAARSHVVFAKATILPQNVPTRTSLLVSMPALWRKATTLARSQHLPTPPLGVPPWAASTFHRRCGLELVGLASPCGVPVDVEERTICPLCASRTSARIPARTTSASSLVCSAGLRGCMWVGIARRVRAKDLRSSASRTGRLRRGRCRRSMAEVMTTLSSAYSGVSRGRDLFLFSSIPLYCKRQTQCRTCLSPTFIRACRGRPTDRQRSPEAKLYPF